MAFTPGTLLDRFRLLEQLGEGGQGSVWRAEDPLAPGRSMALKLVAMPGASASHIERVRREARALAHLEHPSLVGCHGMFEDLKSETLGLVLDYVKGASLDDARHDARWEASHPGQVLSHVAAALAYLHQRGIVHRDLKLENILIEDGFWSRPDDPHRVKLVDFGIAAMLGAPSGLTAVGHIVGTPAFMAPELLDPAYHGGGIPTPAADVFAFGVVGWKLLVGEHPTGLPSGSSVVDYAAAYRHGVASQPAWSQQVPATAWGRLLAACLATSPHRRIPDGQTLEALCAEVRAGREPDVASWQATRTEYSPAPRGVTATVDDPRGTQTVQVSGARGATEPAIRPERRPTEQAAPEPALFASPRSASARNAGATAASPARGKGSGAGAALVVVVGGGLVVLSIVVAVSLGVMQGVREDVAPAAAAASQPHPPSAVTDSFEGRANPVAPAPPAPAVEPAPEPDPTLPKACKASDPLCACCPAGRSCGPGACSDALKPADEFLLRLWSVKSPGIKAPLLTDPSVRVCVRRAAVPVDGICTRLRDTLGGKISSALKVRTNDLTRSGLMVEVSSTAWRANAVVRHELGIKRSALCLGLRFGNFGSEHVDSVVFYLDDVNDDPALHECQWKHGHVALAPADRGFSDQRGGWGWGDRCYTHLKSGAYAWAKAACEKALGTGPSVPKPARLDPLQPRYGGAGPRQRRRGPRSLSGLVGHSTASGGSSGDGSVGCSLGHGSARPSWM